MRTRYRIAIGATLFLVLSAQGALACPAASDLETGIQFFNPDGTSEVHTRLDGARIQMDYLDPNVGSVTRSILIHGVHLQWVGELADGSGDMLSAYTYVTPVEDLPVPADGLQWAGVQTELSGSDTFPRDVQMSVGTPFTWQLEACVYTALPVSITANENGALVYTEEIYYLPDIGTGVLVAYIDPDGRFPIAYNRVEAVAAGE